MKFAAWFSFLCLSLSVAAASELDRPMVWCHYVAWHDWNKASAASHRHYDFPLVHPSGDSQRDYRAEIDEAIREGIDGFVVDIVEAEAFSDQMVSMLHAAEGTTFKITGCLDGFTLPPEQFADRVAKMLRRVERCPNLARVDGKPYFTTFWGYRTPPDRWKRFREILKQKGFEIFIAGDPNTAPNEAATLEKLGRHAGCFDMFYSFAEYNRLGAQPLADTYRAIAEGAGKFAMSGKWMAGIGPGYVGPWPLNGRNDYYIPFRGIDHLWDCWQCAAANRPAWIHLTTWNDLDETPLQPMLFSFHAYPEINRWWIDHWRGVDRIAALPRVYAVYQREQLLGTVQRIEVLSLPSKAKDLTISGELRGLDGTTLFNLPSRHIAGDKPTRCDWAVPTTQFAASPIVEPVLEIAADGKKAVRRLPFFRLRTGWIANQAVVRAPMHEMAQGQALLTVEKSDDDILAAAVNVASSEPVRHITLFRNDRPVGAFWAKSPDKPIFSIVLESQGDCDLKASVSGGRLLDAYLTMGGVGKTRLTWDAASLSAAFDKYHYFGLKLSGDAKTTLAISTHGNAHHVSIAELIHDGQTTIRDNRGKPMLVVRLSDIDAIAANPPTLDDRQNEFAGRWHVDAMLPDDAFYARCETADGRVFFSNVVVPFAAKLPSVQTNILQTAKSLDCKPSQFLTDVPQDLMQTTAVAVHPAMVQRIEWLFDQGDGSRDSAGRNPLHLGSAADSYAVASNRIPKREKRQDAPGWCLAFDGIDDIAEIPIRQMPVGSFTVELDVFPEKAGQMQTILERVGSQGCPAIRLTADEKLQAGRIVGPHNTSVMATSPAPLPIGKWSNVRVTFNETTVRLFINGKLVATAAGKPAREYGNAREYLGGLKTPFHGKLANVRITSVAE